MQTIVDKRLGEIVIGRSRRSRSITARVAPQGILKLTCPYFTPSALINFFIIQNIEKLIKLKQIANSKIYTEGQIIGKTHKLKTTSSKVTSIFVRNNFLIVELSPSDKLSDETIQSLIKKEVAKILRTQAKAYLPHRISYLAQKYGFSYGRLRFSHASSRWGSCSSEKTISLNITLMNLDHELIDYVIIHELCHTRVMNHSTDFWDQVKQILPNYKNLIKKLRNHSPLI